MSPPALRAIASRLVPDAGKRALDRARARRYLSVVRPATDQYVARNGLEVRGGPFAGMRYPQELQGSVGDLVAKLTGCYELELHAAVADWLSAPPAVLVDVGCAEGYYAVGFALALPQTRVIAYDTDPAARQRCAALARTNGVEDRIAIEGECSPATLRRYGDQDLAVFSDCEGYERVLLDPAAVPALGGWRIIVELHEFLDAGISDEISTRFAATHNITLIDTRPRDTVVPETTAFMEPAARRAALSENRPGPMRWAALSPLRKDEPR